MVMLVGLGAASLLIQAFGGRQLERAREQRTLATLAQARDALLGFAAVNGRLPRPAASAVDGRESPSACASEAACSGFLPWVTLGVAGADSWGKLLRYSVTPAFTRAPLNWSTLVASKSVQGRDRRGALYYLAGAPRCAVGGICAPFVLVSNGRNNFGTSVAGLRQASASLTNTDEAANDGAGTRFISRAASDDTTQAGGEFDDLVLWLPQITLYKRVSAAGK